MTRINLFQVIFSGQVKESDKALKKLDKSLKMYGDLKHVWLT